jgi:hypothetical protein
VGRPQPPGALGQQPGGDALPAVRLLDGRRNGRTEMEGLDELHSGTGGDLLRGWDAGVGSRQGPLPVRHAGECVVVRASVPSRS